MSLADEQFDVVIVGAGPGGLAGAITLGGYGIRTLVVERRPSPSTLPRANSASTKTMELLRRWGLEREAREHAVDVEFQAWQTKALTAKEGEAIDVGFPTREQAALISPTRPAAIGQDALEPLLEKRVRSFDSTRLERGVELLSLEHAVEGCVLTLAGPGGRRRRVHARYVIGADGMHSKVRDELGVATEGSENIDEKLGVHFRAPIWELVGDRRYGIYFLTDANEGRFLVPVGLPDRWILGMDWDSASRSADQLTAAELARWIREAVGDPNLAVEIDHVMPVTYGVSLAERFREDDAFLIGDAAHRVTPRGGTGLNTAIHDAADLGWKLAWVLRGWADEPLLDSYERERRPVAEHNTGRSVRPDGSIFGISHGLNADIGGRIPHVWVLRESGLVSTLDLLGDGLTLFAGPDWDGTIPGGDAGSAPVAVERLDAISARALGLSPEGALVARPDGHPAALMQLSAQ